ncbi:hypothetical protein [Kribbella sp. CA-293567]|uniref:hypothetical protein n=1 Tax=Kribbella sp. CA-293567 TaxID=3002436 RepID=UPI0022DD7D66|nr:hypothetical protein [Kribbella sp. CA-293567]WBQ05023.1 hypothetical protein OX958_34365 [Kribbella sp. CA-293567]
MSQQLREVLPRHHRRAFGRGAMTAALVIVPVHSARARARLGRDSAAQAGKGPRGAGGIHAVPGELPWMVRLSTAGGAETGAVQRPLTVEPWVDPTGSNASPRTRLLAAVPAYRLVSHIF